MSWIAMSRTTAAQEDCAYFDELTMGIIRAARLVGIPKPEGGVRPIVVSSFIAKLCGALILRRAGVRRLRNQYAIAYRDGGPRIVHRTREAYDNGKAVIRIDSSNAYNITKRKRILEMLGEKLQLGDSTVTSEMIQYFVTMYQPVSNMYYFGPRGSFEVIKAAEGVRQGDALSSFYFCLVMEKVTDELLAYARERDIRITCECYMDDSTIVCDPEHAAEIARKTIEIMRKYGFEVNTEKSGVVCKNPLPGSDDASAVAMPIPVLPSSRMFKILGGVINDVYDELHAMLRGRIDRFFDSLDELVVHPEIKHTLMYFCGLPKLIYFASTTPPEHALAVLQHFEERCKRSFARLIDVDPSAISEQLLHASEGAGLPDYVNNSSKLYANSKSAAFSPGAFVPRVKLTTSSTITSHVEAEYDSCWLRYVHPTLHRQLSPSLYTVALAMRVLQIPRHVYTPDTAIRCECNELCRGAPAIIAHALICKDFSGITPGARHTFLKAGVQGICRAYGIPCANEPGFYRYQEAAPVRQQQPVQTDDATTTHTNDENNNNIHNNANRAYIVKQRPDCTFYTGGTIVVTDYTIVTPKPNEPGVAAAHAANEKRKTHTAAAAAAGHEFIPFAVETTGHLDGDCFKLFKRLANNVPPSKKYSIQRDLFGATSSAIAEYRARAVVNACHVQLTLAYFA